MNFKEYVTEGKDSNKSIYIDSKLHATPSNDDKALRSQLGFITGFPDSSKSTIDLHSKLLSKGKAEVWYKGKKVTVEYK